MSSADDGYNLQQLKREILLRGKSADWEVAKREWSLVGIDEAEVAQTCLCGHYPIIEVCAIHNRLTHLHVEVGNVCVKRFLGIRSDQIFDGIKRIRKFPDRSLNSACIAFFGQRDVLTDWEYNFCSDTQLKRNLSEAQLRVRHRINDKVLGAIAQRGFQGFGRPTPTRT
jgi:hypothetical protein